MPLPIAIDGVLTPRIRGYLNAVARSGDELVVDVVSCGYCGAQIGEYCHGVYKVHCKSVHVDRRYAAHVWRKAHPKEWKRMKDETFRRIIKMQGVR